MENIIRCKRCIVPEGLHSVKLDNTGVCNYCLKYEKSFGDWEKIKSGRREEFEDLVQRVKQLNRYYDCLIPLSGGKDSTYVLYLCSKIYGLKCLAITFDNGYLSEHARTNIKNGIEATGADHMFYSINRDRILELYKLFLKKCGNFCPACMKGIAVCIRMAANVFKIPLVVSGGGVRISYVGAIPELSGGSGVFENVIKDERIEKDVSQLKWNISNIQKAIKGFTGIFFRSSFASPRHISIFDYIDISYDEVYDIIEKEMGWGRPKGEAEHMDCLIHGVAFYIHTLKFPDLTKVTLHHSGLIRLGQMTREEAMEIENEELAKSQRPHILDSFLEEIGMSEDEFESSVRDWRTIEKFHSQSQDFIKSLYRKISR